MTETKMLEIKEKVFTWWLESIVSSLTISEWCKILDYTEETSPSRLLQSNDSFIDELPRALFNALSDDDLVEVVGPLAIKRILNELEYSLPIKVDRLKLG